MPRTDGSRGVLPRLAVFMARHRRRVFAGWLIAVVAGLIGLPHLLGSLLAPPIEVTGSESRLVSRMLADGLPTLGDEPMIAVLHSDARKASDPSFRKAIDAGMDALADERAVSGVLLLPVAGDPGREISLPETFEPLRPLFHDEHTAYVYVGTTGEDRARQELAPALQEAADRAARRASGGEVRAYLVGISAFGELVQEVEIRDLMRIELVALPLAVAVLWWGLRRPVAAMVPVVVAVASVITTLGLFAASTRIFTIDGMLLVGVNALGLGIGIDYALFVMNRFREELVGGAEPLRAIATASATAGRTVLYSALILMSAYVTLFLVRWHVFLQVAIGCMAVVVVVAIASLTLLPALLCALGPALEWRGPGRSRPVADDESRRLTRWAEHLMRQPWPYAIAVTALLLCAALPTGSMRTGIDLERGALAGTAYHTGFTIGERDVPGTTGSVFVALEQPEGQPLPDTRVLADALRADPAVAAVTSIDNGDRLTALLVLSRHAIDTPEVGDLVWRIRDRIVPAAAPPGVAVLVGGPGAHVADILAETAAKLWWVIGCVLALLFVLLVAVLRSLVLPLKAILMSLLATGASYGLTVLVFQRDGHPIWPQVPLIAFVMLFGLSTDYELFLVRRIQEEYLRTGDNRRSVVIGLRSTARPISLAAAILAVGYGSLLVSSINGLREFGFAVAVALIIDATLIRLVLVPALMQIMGRWNWWLPGGRPGRPPNGRTRPGTESCEPPPGSPGARRARRHVPVPPNTDDPVRVPR
ncbi:MMPL family transporter [Nocardia sp. CDC159]|uniref:MMPL family transporter n=1 Tax=Nocardia pulmonis TaxID=2951408 RepID=A0A9X2IZ44_9NOCA|nr:MULTISPECIES: MMPL family transporter [Nocardia]MCM6777113.1 MMPL family transporter [Nocardia pulmonis]MCM6789998.1 MMPL family transporter [Nocardia sp. CDC159]